MSKKTIKAHLSLKILPASSTVQSTKDLNRDPRLISSLKSPKKSKKKLKIQKKIPTTHPIPSELDLLVSLERKYIKRLISPHKCKISLKPSLLQKSLRCCESQEPANNSFSSLQAIPDASCRIFSPIKSQKFKPFMQTP
jgi:hypothetical protein